MLGISELFKRIQNVRTKEVFIRTVVVEAIKKYVGLEIKIEDVSFNSGNIRLANLNQSARSAIFIKKTAILEDINKNQTLRKIDDIK